jgi:hypothetical protein
MHTIYAIWTMDCLLNELSKHGEGQWNSTMEVTDRDFYVTRPLLSSSS